MFRSSLTHALVNCPRMPRCAAGSSWLPTAVPSLHSQLSSHLAEGRHTSHVLNLICASSSVHNLPGHREHFRLKMPGAKLHSAHAPRSPAHQNQTHLLKRCSSKMSRNLCPVIVNQNVYYIYIIFCYLWTNNNCSDHVQSRTFLKLIVRQSQEMF